MGNFILKGNIIFSDADRTLNVYENSYVVCENGISRGVFRIFDDIPSTYRDFELIDKKESLIIPGLVDLHVHAPQYSFRGFNMDEELLDWLNNNTFPEEAKYSDLEYAEKAYSIFADDIKKSFTTRAVIFGTIHKDATLLLMDKMEKSGLISYVGKVNMTRNSPDYLSESIKGSISATEEWLKETDGKFNRTMPILTPRFIPSCDDEMMEWLGQTRKRLGLRVQSHLSENPSEIQWVQELVPTSKGYGDAYNINGMLGSKENPAIMAHCVYSDKAERDLLKECGTFVAHSPESNLNLSSGIAPISLMLKEGINVGLATDIAAGSSISMMKQITLAIQASKMYWRYIDNNVKPLSFADAFYIATLGGGKFFGKVGSFEDGYEFDALVLDDSAIRTADKVSVVSRIERAAYNEREIKITDKYVKGMAI
ncbi:MAG: amidohydrolase family protein [Lachnospiraceae bacterium]|nr:amidohydrolase family protein [Lachnospiraceae bacterium]